MMLPVAKTAEFKRTARDAAEKAYNSGRRSASKLGADELESAVVAVEVAMERAVRLHASLTRTAKVHGVDEVVEAPRVKPGGRKEQ